MSDSGRLPGLCREHGNFRERCVPCLRARVAELEAEVADHQQGLDGFADIITNQDSAIAARDAVIAELVAACSRAKTAVEREARIAWRDERADAYRDVSEQCAAAIASAAKLTPPAAAVLASAEPVPPAQVPARASLPGQ